jgi:hypothetical protein
MPPQTEVNVMGEKYYQLKVSLKGITPMIWRRIVVTSSANLEQLHEIIIRAMGWTGGHLHLFEVGGQLLSGESGDPLDQDDGLLARDYTLGQVAGGKGHAFTYIYDFGDDWQHRILVESADYDFDKPAKGPAGKAAASKGKAAGGGGAAAAKGEAKAGPGSEDHPLAFCLAGKRACPPEDCGGVYGYMEFCEIMADPEHEEHEERAEWYGEETFDPDDFDLAEANLRILAGLDRIFKKKPGRGGPGRRK